MKRLDKGLRIVNDGRLSEMVTVTVRFAKPRDPVGFERHYFGTHLPVGKSLPGIEHVRVQSDMRTRRMYTTMEFADDDALIKAFASVPGQVAFYDMPRLLKYLLVPPMISFSGLQHPWKTKLRFMGAGIGYLLRRYQ